MEDIYFFTHSLQNFRKDTFIKPLRYIKIPFNYIIELSKSGFYFHDDNDSFIRNENIKNHCYFNFIWNVRCFQCNLQFDLKKLLNINNLSTDIIEYHRKNLPIVYLLKIINHLDQECFFHLKKVYFTKKKE